MEFTVERKAMLDAVEPFIPLLPGASNPLQVLKYLIVEPEGQDVCRITGTNLSTMLTRVVKAEMTGKAKGKLYVQGRPLRDILRLVDDGSVQIKEERGRVKIFAGAARFKLLGLDCLQFPDLRPFQWTDESAPSFVLPAETWRRVVKRVNFAVGEDSANFEIGSVLVEIENGKHVRVVATNGHQLAMAEVNVTTGCGDRSAIVPEFALAASATWTGDVSVSLGDTVVVMAGSDGQMVTRLGAGRFPAYRQVINPETPIRVYVDRDELLAVLARVKPLADEKVPIVRLTIEPNALGVDIENEREVATESVVGTTEGALNSPLPLLLNLKYLLAAVKACGQDVMIGCKDSLTQVLVRDAKDDDVVGRQVIMPMKAVAKK